MDNFVWPTALDWRDVIDILAMTVLFYLLLKFLRGTRAVQMGLGVAALIFLYALTGYLEINTLHQVMRAAVSALPILIIVVFQATIRRGLTELGSTFFAGLFRGKTDEKFVDDMVHVVFALSRKKRGALLVFERSQGLRPYVESGVILDAVPSYDLLMSIFEPNTPLHDGAVLLRGRKLMAAACFLPLTKQTVSTHLGTRHRAALGISEETDALVIVVSEETGGISLCVEGKIRQRLTEILLKRLLHQYLFTEEGKKQAKKSKEARSS